MRKVLLAIVFVLLFANLSFAMSDRLVNTIRFGTLTEINDYRSIGEVLESSPVLSEHSWDSIPPGRVVFIAKIEFRPYHFEVYESLFGELNRRQIHELNRVGEAFLHLVFDFINDETFYLNMEDSSQFMITPDGNYCDFEAYLVRDDIYDLYSNPNRFVLRLIDFLVNDYPCSYRDNRI